MHLETIKFYPELDECIKSILSNAQHRALFLELEAVIGVFILFIFIMDHQPYKSSVYKVTPTISIPVPVGEGQHGTAWFLSKDDKARFFKTYKLFHEKPELSCLIKAGVDDQKEIPITPSSLSFKERIEATQKVIRYKANAPNRLINKQLSRFYPELPKSGGLVVGADIDNGCETIHYIDEDIHSLIIGATRSGKGRNCLLQSIAFTALAGESMVITDVKSEQNQFTSKFLQRLLYSVIVLDFKNPKKSRRYNFLQPVINALDKDDIPKAIESTWDVVSQLVGEAKGEKIWTNGEASIIAASIMAVVFDNREEGKRKFQNLTNVYYFIANMCKDIDGKMPIIEYMKKLPDSHPSKGLVSISEIAPERTRGSFYTSALTTLQLFTNPLIHYMTSESDFDLKDLGLKKTALFIVLPDEKSTYNDVAALFINQMYVELVALSDMHGGRLPIRVNNYWDEFGNITKLANLTNMLTVGGGRGIRFNFALQAFGQLDEIYGKEAAQIIRGNCENWVYLFTKDTESRKVVSEQMGTYTTGSYSLSANHAKGTNPSSSHSNNLIARDLLKPEEVGSIERPYTLVLAKTKPIIFTSPDLSEWSFNKMFGMGSKSHNTILRDLRENSKTEHSVDNKIDLWGIWTFYIRQLEMTKQSPKGSFRQDSISKDFLNKFTKTYTEGGNSDETA